MHRHRGFTFVELIAALVIVGIVVAIGAPRLIDNRPFTERGYADEIAGALRHAQRVAIASNCNVRFVVNAAGYNATQRNVFATCRTAGAWTTPVLLSDGTALIGATPAGVVVNGAVAEFDNTGALVTPIPQMSVGPFVLNVAPATGAVTVQ
jgi:MSHA pilin protein MshC